MEIICGQAIHGFKVNNIQTITELKSTGYEMVHQKSGAKLYYLKSEDDNKVFSVSFRTPPEDSTGLPHILEHSVLCGSEKYPLKDPFVELAKGSLNTFLNAMTFSDKTMYPIASRNDQDFMNLMDVYMNAVFYPNLHHQPEILKQEGWHYELDSLMGPLKIKGVVYNEMKGAFSSPEQVLFRKIQETLFPDTPYGFESGGDPDVIPELSQDRFCKYHKTYYHPSNAYFYLYGNGDMDQHLAHINDQYLAHFDRIEVGSAIPLQAPFAAPEEVVVQYPVGKEEDTANKTYLSLNYVTGKTTDPEQQLAMEMLNYLLLGTSAAPLKKALIKAGVGQDVFGSFDSSILQPVFSIVVKNSDSEKKELFMKLVEDTLNQLILDGIDKEYIESVINIHEFKLREADFGRYPKGLVYGMKLMESWLYDEDPALHLEFEKTLPKIRESLQRPYFENLIKSMLLDNNHRNLLMIVPEKGLNEAKEQQLVKVLEEKKAAMQAEEIKRLIHENQALQEWQDKPHSEEELAVMPLLTLEDLEQKPEIIPSDLDSSQGYNLLKHPMFTNQIQYTSLYFDVMNVEDNDLHYLGLLVRMLGRLSTRSYSYEALSNQLNLHTGGIYATTEAVPTHEMQEKSRYFLKIKGKSLVKKTKEFWHLVDEIYTGTQWDDYSRIREVLREVKSRIEMSLHQEGHMVAARRALATFSTEAAFNELVGGVNFYHFLCDLEEGFENRINDAARRMQAILKEVVVRKNSLVSYTGDEQGYVAYEPNMAGFMNTLEESGETKTILERSSLGQGNEGLILPSQVQYVAKASNFLKHGAVYTGSMQVLRTVLSLDYLWKRIRVSGGAYGAMAGFSRNGNCYFVSYRDPNLKETLQVYDEMADYLRAFKVSQREMTKYIIGTMSRLDMPLTASMKGDKADAQFLSGFTWKSELVERQQIIGTTIQDIRSLGDLVDNMMQDTIYCVVGNETTVKNAASLFDKIVVIKR